MLLRGIVFRLPVTCIFLHLLTEDSLLRCENVLGNAYGSVLVVYLRSEAEVPSLIIHRKVEFVWA